MLSRGVIANKNLHINADIDLLLIYRRKINDIENYMFCLSATLK